MKTHYYPLYSVRSAIDNRPLDGVHSRRIHALTDHISDCLAIRWSEVFYIEYDVPKHYKHNLEDSLAKACCTALTPHLGNLHLDHLSQIALRVTISLKQVNIFLTILYYFLSALQQAPLLQIILIHSCQPFRFCRNCSAFLSIFRYSDQNCTNSGF